MFGYKTLTNWYKEIGDFVRYSDYSLTELKQLLPYEFTVYKSILLSQLEEEKKGAK